MRPQTNVKNLYLRGGALFMGPNIEEGTHGTKAATIARAQVVWHVRTTDPKSCTVHACYAL